MCVPNAARKSFWTQRNTMKNRKSYYKTKATWPIHVEELRQRRQQYLSYFIRILLLVPLSIVIIFAIRMIFAYYDFRLIPEENGVIFFLIILFFIIFSVSVVQYILHVRFDLKCPDCKKVIIGINWYRIIATGKCAKCNSEIVTGYKSIGEIELPAAKNISQRHYAGLHEEKTGSYYRTPVVWPVQPEEFALRHTQYKKRRSWTIGLSLFIGFLFFLLAGSFIELGQLFLPKEGWIYKTIFYTLMFFSLSSYVFMFLIIKHLIKAYGLRCPICSFYLGEINYPYIISTGRCCNCGTRILTPHTHYTDTLKKTRFHNCN